MLRRGLGGSAAAVVVVLALSACTTTPGPEDTTSPSPSLRPEPSAAAVPEAPGDRVAVIVPPETVVAPAEGAALVRAGRDLAEAPPDGVAEVRVTPAMSDAFVRDLAHLAVDDGYDVVCVVGTGAAELVLELARARREARFCTTDGRVTGGPVNLVAVAVDPVALVEAGAVAIGTAPAPVGFLASAQLGEAEALTTAFTTRVAPPRQPPGPASSPQPSPGPSPSPDAPGPTSPQPPFVTAAPGLGAPAQVSAAEQLAAQRPSRALVLATPGGTGAAAAIGAAGVQQVVVADWAVDGEGELPPSVLVALTVDWAVLLVNAVAAARTADAPQVQLLGVADDVLGALPGQAEGAGAAADRTADHIRRSAQ